MVAEVFQVKHSLQKTIQHQPGVSIVMPFEPKMSAHSELELQIQRMPDRVQKRLLNSYSEETAQPLIDRLRRLLTTLDFTSFKKSVAIFVSPFTEKLYYLNIDMREQIVVNERFQIRDLISCKKDSHNYLVLVLSATRNQIFVGNSEQFSRILSNTREHPSSHHNEISHGVASFSDPSDRKEILLNEFLHDVDNSLTQILSAYDLPLFVIGPACTTDHFKKITHHWRRIINYVHGNFEDASPEEISNAVAPFVEDWKNVREAHLIRKLDTAMNTKTLAVGIHEVREEVRHQRGQLLVVEKNYIHSVINTEKKPGEMESNLVIHDAVDDIIEKILQSGGDVEFVDPGVLNKYKHIALVKMSLT